MDTSLMAYLNIKHQIPSQCESILSVFDRVYSATREEIMEHTGLKINVVTARVNYLVKHQKLEVIGYRPSFNSRQQVEVLGKVNIII